VKDRGVTVVVPGDAGDAGDAAEAAGGRPNRDPLPTRW